MEEREDEYGGYAHKDDLVNSQNVRRSFNSFTAEGGYFPLDPHSVDTHTHTHDGYILGMLDPRASQPTHTSPARVDHLIPAAARLNPKPFSSAQANYIKP